MWTQAGAIVQAQFRSLGNLYTRGNRGAGYFTLSVTLAWYALCIGAASFIGYLVATTREVRALRGLMAPGLVLITLYWQLIPVLMVTTGATLNLKRLRVYPVAHRSLFTLEVILRLSTAVEVLLVTIGGGIGLALNPSLRVWAPVALAPFVGFNVFLSVAIRDLLSRVLGWKRFREFGVLVLVLAAALPQVLMRSNPPAWLKQGALQVAGWPWPHTLATRLALGEGTWLLWMGAVLWVAAAYGAGRFLFERNLLLDEEESAAGRHAGTEASSLTDRLFRLPGRLFRDPLAALIEKDLRTLSRSARFRLLFLMGFSFSLLVWLPMATAQGQSGLFASHYLTFLFAYALMLLSEVPLWNAFGFDRTAAQVYYLAPVEMRVILAGKNLTMVVVALLEMGMITLVCVALRLPLGVAQVGEALAVVLAFLVYLIAIGNLSSVYYPRPIDPGQSWRSGSASKFQALLLLIYPLVALPFGLAYLARYAFESEWAFYGVVAVCGALGGVLYKVSLESAVQASEKRKERFLSALGQGQSPVST